MRRIVFLDFQRWRLTYVLFDKQKLGLFLFKVNLLLINHFRILCKPLFNFYSISVDVCPLQDRFVSSANIEASVVCKQFGSLIYTKNSKGPRFEPCGTPQQMSVSLDIYIIFSDINTIETTAKAFLLPHNVQAWIGVWYDQPCQMSF